MANDYIQIDLSGNFEASATLWGAIRSLREARGKLERCRDWAVHSTDGSNYAAVETLFRVPAGTGAALFLLLDGSLQAMDGTSSGYVDELVSRVGPR